MNSKQSAVNGLLLCSLFSGYCSLVACAPISLTRPVTKLGLVAPFEGQQRAVGYEALYAVKLALRERNAAGGVAGWLVELVALNESGSLDQSGSLDHNASADQASRQARALAVDADVTTAIALTSAAEQARVQSQYAQVGLPIDLLDPQSADAQPDAPFVERYRALSGGASPGPLAVRVYAATQSALARIERNIRANGRPTR